MLTYKENNCETILLTSPSLEDFVSELYETPVAVHIDCGNNQFDLELTLPNFEEIDSVQYLVLTPELLNQEGKLSDGIYYIKVTVTENNQDKTIEDICIFLGCDLKCLLIDYLAENPKSDVFKYEMALNWINDCDVCSCDKGRLIYNTLLDILKNGEKSPCDC